MGFVAFGAIFLAAGWGGVRAVWPEAAEDAGVRMVRAGLAVGLGLAIASLSEFAWLLGLRALPHSLFALDAVLAMGLLAIAFVRIRRHRDRPVSVEPPGRRPWVLSLAFLGALAVNVAAFVAMSRRGPHGGWDAFAMWNVRARFFYLAGDRWVDGLAASLPHSDYPLLVPTAIAHAWQYMGVPDPVAQMLVAGAFTFSAVLILTGALWHLRGAVTGLVGGLLFLGTPSFFKLGGRQMADVPLAFWLLATVSLLCLADAQSERDRRWRLLVLAGACAGLAAWTKNEGTLFVLALVAVEVFRALASGLRPLLARLAALGLGMAPALLAVAWFRLTFPLANDLVAGQGTASTLSRVLDPGRYGLILRAFGEQVVSGGEYLAVGLVLYLVVCGWPKRVRLPWASGLLLLIVAAYFAVYVLTPHDLQWHLSTSLDRLVIQLMPGALLVALVAAGPGRSRRGLVECSTPEEETS